MPRKPKRQPLSIRLYQDEALQTIARLVGYCGRSYPMSEEETKRLYERFGKERITAAADELLDYDSDAKTAKLKRDVRKLCFGLLGPAPEQEDWFYCNPDGTPTERPKNATKVDASSWETARPIAAVKKDMRKERRTRNAAPSDSSARENAEDELNRLREELSYAADRLAFARHADFSQPSRTSRSAESAQEYVVWKLRRERDALREQLEAATAGHGDEQVIEALQLRLDRVQDELEFQVEEALHDMVH